MNIICPVNNEHKTTDPLYCSTCGAKIVPTADENSAIEKSTIEKSTIEKSSIDKRAQVTVCPDCRTERANLKIGHCQVCRFNFEAKAYNRFKTTIDLRTKSGASAAQKGAAESIIAKTLKESAVAEEKQQTDENWEDSVWQPNKRWEIFVVVDASLYQPPDPKSTAPDEPDRVFHLDTAECLVGRKSESRKVYPEVCINDPGVSHRHFKLLKDKEEQVHILDVGSANGTTLNDEILPAGVKKLLRHGDQITLGCWTRITVQLATIE